MNRSQTSDRQHYVDALRVFAVVMLIVFHTAMLFNTHEFHLKNVPTSRAVGVFIDSPIYFWHMPLFMLLAGASTWYAFGKRGLGDYLGERVKRILLPLLIGIAVVIPPQVYFERVYNGDFSGSFLAFYPTFWTNGLYPRGNFTYNHLWFLAFLFIFVLVTAPLFAFLKSDRGRRVLDGLAALLGHPLTLLLIPFATIALGEWWLRPQFPTTRIFFNDWANFVYYLQFFIYGFLIVSSERALKAIDRLRWITLAGAVGLTAVSLYFDWTRRYPDLGGQAQIEALFGIFGVLISWCWLLALMGLGRRYLNRTSPFLRYASEIAYPYYILHQTVILAIGFYVLPLAWSLEVKLIFIMLTSFFGTAALCELVKQTHLTRFCFGMKPKPRQPDSPVQQVKPA
jgi:surface polysaccharide O-acyltransferase-like enzyme